MQAADAPALRLAAHSMKSSSANVGAFQLAELSKTLEDMGHRHDLARAGEVLAQLHDVYTAVETALTAVVQQTSAAPLLLTPARESAAPEEAATVLLVDDEPTKSPQD